MSERGFGNPFTQEDGYGELVDLYARIDDLSGSGCEQAPTLFGLHQAIRDRAEEIAEATGGDSTEIRSRALMDAKILGLEMEMLVPEDLIG